MMKSSHPQFKKPDTSIDDKMEAIIDKMTFEEKCTLLGGRHDGTLPVERVGIPQFRMADGPVGVHWWCDASTAYPVTVGLSASWNPALSRRFGKAIGRDCRARGVHLLLAPGVNIYRSPYCGRNFEYMGEDPALTSQMVVPIIKGVQSQAVSVTMKHFAVNYQEFDRHGVSSDVDERTLREVYLPAFEAAVKEGGAGAIMTAYNLVNGEHCSQNGWLNNKVLRGEWGFDGVVMSDWTSVYDTVGPLNGGLDLEMPDAIHLTAEKIKPAIENGLVSIETINDKIRNLLRLAFAFGWMDNDQLDPSIPEDDPTSVKVALDMARESCVLLKNEDKMLPLNPKGVKKIAVIGYQADPAVLCGGGSAFTTPFRSTSVLEGITSRFGKDVEVVFERAYTPEPLASTAYREIFVRDNGEPGVKAEYWKGDMQGEPDDILVQKNMDVGWGQGVPIKDKGYAPENFFTRWTGTFTPQHSGEHIMYINASGTLRITLNEEEIISRGLPKEGSQYQEFHIPLEADKPCRLVAESQIKLPWNRLKIGIASVREWEEMQENACRIAAESDAVIFCAGFATNTETEGSDRSFELPAGQSELISKIAEANSNTCVLLFSGGGVDFTGWADKVKSIIQVWYPGQEGGKAIAEILSGDYNPCGKLPMTMDRKIEERSSYDNYHCHDGLERLRESKRVRITDGIFTGYRHNDRYDIEPQFPFGHGLSYTTFDISNLRLSETSVKKTKGVKATVTVTNTGDRKGAEVVQLYVADLEASQPRPVKELKGFKKISLKPGESKDVTISLNAKAWRFWHPDLKNWTVEPGGFEIHVGNSATNITCREKIQVTE